MTTQPQMPSTPDTGNFAEDNCFACGAPRPFLAAADYLLRDDDMSVMVQLDAQLNLESIWWGAYDPAAEVGFFLHVECVEPFATRLQRDVQDARARLEEFRAEHVAGQIPVDRPSAAR